MPSDKAYDAPSENPQCKPVGVDCAARKGRSQSPIDESNVGPIPTTNDVPGLLPGSWREQDQSGLVGEIA